MTKILARVRRGAHSSLFDNALDLQPKMIVFGVLATLGFPFYHYLWSLVHPEVHENLRLFSAYSIVGLPLLLCRYWPAWMQGHLRLYWYAALAFTLPFSITYMLLHNGADSIWPMASVAGLFLLFLIVDSAVAIAVSIVGTVAAIAFFTVFEGHAVPLGDYLGLLSAYSFALLTATFFYLGSAREQRAKIMAARALGSHVGHELRNPLATIRLGADRAQECLPELVASYRLAKAAGLDVPPIAESHLELAGRVCELTIVEVDYSLMVIDMMLKKAGGALSDVEACENMRILASLERGVERYAFKSREEKAIVRIDTRADFTIYANEHLFHHVLFNLLKNALYAIKAAGRRKAGTIHIWATPGGRDNHLHFRDNGIGMSAQTLARVFDPFFTTRDKGTGLGLHFCRDVMHRFGGEIICVSSQGYFTEFILRFPAVSPVPARPPEPARSAWGLVIGKGEVDTDEGRGWQVAAALTPLPESARGIGENRSPDRAMQQASARSHVSASHPGPRGAVRVTTRTRVPSESSLAR